jgi:hypothetical protein
VKMNLQERYCTVILKITMLGPIGRYAIYPFDVQCKFHVGIF